MYEMKGKVRYSEIDQSGKITIPAIINYFQDCSTFQSEDLGVGYGVLKSQQKSWILSAWQIVIEEYVGFSEEIRIGTFATGFEGLYGTRNFLMYDSERRKVAYANSIWIYMDLKKGRPIRPDEEEVKRYGVEPAIAMKYEGRKIVIPAETVKGTPFSVRKYNIDTNGHVNNCQYIQMAIEALTTLDMIKQVRVEYKKSAIYGDIIYPEISVTKERIVVDLCDIKGKSFAIVEFKGE